MIPRVFLTTGEPAGIGPDLCLQVAQQDWSCCLTVVGDADLLRARAALLGLDIKVRTTDADHGEKHRPGRLDVWPVAQAADPTPGKLDPANADYILSTIRVAAEAALAPSTALVTPPVHKGNINDAGIPFSGHTEYLAEIVGGKPVMLLAAPGLRVALVTTHLPLAAVSAAITRDALETTLRVLHRDLRRRFGISQPRILVAGLNPHAGEGGHLGREEIDTIGPVLDALRKTGMALEGPLPADTLFLPNYLRHADAVLAMYHDQGLPVLKHLGFGESVNITLGLPIIRTSVDHGTALDLAGTGQADAGSLRAALAAAIDMAQRDRAAA